MKLIDLTVKHFLDEVDSSSPAPGGGSSSALMSALGISLARMVGHLTVTKKKFLNLEPDIQTQFNETLKTLEQLKIKLTQLIDLDTDAYNKIVAAYRLLKTDESRKQKIEDATLGAIEIPEQIGLLSLEALKQLSFILAYGNQSAISDMGVSALSLATGVEGAVLNVLINLPGLSDETLIEQFKTTTQTLLKEAHALKENILALVYQALS